MPRKTLSLALVAALLLSQQASAARFSERAREQAPKGERFDLQPRRTSSDAGSVLDLQPTILEIADTAPRELSIAGVGGEAAETRERPALQSLETSVQAAPRGAGGVGDAAQDGRQDAHWKQFFHGTEASAAKDAVDPAGDPAAPVPHALIASRAAPAPRAFSGATLYSTAAPAALALPSGISWAWSQLALLPWWGKLLIAAPAVWILGRIGRYAAKKVTARFKIEGARAQRLAVAGEWGTRAAATLGFAIAWVDVDKSTAELLSVVTTMVVKMLTNDYILGTFLLVNHPFYIGERIRVNVDEKGEKDYIVHGISWSTMMLKDPNEPSAEPKKIRHSKFIEKTVTLHRAHQRSGALWIRKLAFTVAPGLVKAPESPIQPLKAPSTKSLVVSGALAAGLGASAVAIKIYLYPWLAAIAALAAIVPAATFGWKALQAIGAKRGWEPGAERAIARVIVALGAVVGVHLAFALAGVNAEKLLTSLGLGVIGIILLTLDVIKPLVTRLVYQFEGDIIVGNRVELSGKYVGEVRDLIANYVVLRLPSPPDKPDEVIEQLVPYSQIVSHRRLP